jgi:hypothetical protein
MPDVSANVGIMASAATEATDYPTITPNGDAFVCAVKRAAGRLLSGGVQVSLINPGSAGTPTEGQTAGTLKAELVVLCTHHVGLADEYTFEMSPRLLLCDFSADPVVAFAAGDVLSCGAGENVCDDGDMVQVVYYETGDLGDDGDSGVIGSRPQLVLLDWPFTRVS